MHRYFVRIMPILPCYEIWLLTFYGPEGLYILCCLFTIKQKNKQFNTNAIMTDYDLVKRGKLKLKGSKHK